MASPDPKWLEILKASGWQTAALTAASATGLFANARKWLPVSLDSWVIQAAEVSVFVFGFLTVFSIGPHVTKTANIIASVFAKRLLIHQGRWGQTGCFLITSTGSRRKPADGHRL
jgi:hypothetical protein